jgi:hypothetical protein
MKHTELEDGDQLVTRAELREVLISIHEDILGIKAEIVGSKTDALGIKTEILGIKTEILGIKGQINDLREMIGTKWWIPVAVAVVTMLGTSAASICAAVILRHH